MDPDGKQIKTFKRQGEKINVLQRYIAHVSNVLFTPWVRCTIQDYDGSNRFVLGCRRSVLFNFRLFLVIVYITYEALK